MAAATATAWTTFGPDMPAASLDPAFLACLPPNVPGAACDALVGSAASGNGFCADPRYARTTYCACVNNAVACPQYAMAACANSAKAYKPWAWGQPDAAGRTPNATCAAAPVCINLVEVGGSQNVVSGITQRCGATTNITRIFRASPTLAAIAFVLVIALVILLLTRAEDRPEGKIPYDGPDPSEAPWNPPGN